MIKKIISGGLPGVELAALRAAIKLNIPHEGWTYKRRRTEKDELPEQFNIKQIANPSYFERLEKNIISESLVRDEMKQNHVRHDALELVERTTPLAA